MNSSDFMLQSDVEWLSINIKNNGDGKENPAKLIPVHKY